MEQGTRWVRVMKKSRGRKSRATVPLSGITPSPLHTHTDTPMWRAIIFLNRLGQNEKSTNYI
jgi:hypothetical protein